MNDTERAEGARLLAAMTPGPWVSGGARDSYFIRRPDPDGKAVAMVTARDPGDTGPTVAFTPDWTFGNAEDDAAGICWLVNHAAELLRDSAELADALSQRDMARTELAELRERIRERDGRRRDAVAALCEALGLLPR